MGENAFEMNIKMIRAVTRELAPKSCYPFRNKGRYSAGFMYTVKGSEIIRFQDRTVKTEPDSLLYFPKGEAYKVMLDAEESEVIVIDFESEQEKSTAPFYIKSNNMASFETLFDKAEKAWVKKNIGYQYECLSYLYGIVYQIIKEQNNDIRNTNDPKIENAVNYLHEHYSDMDFKIKTLYEISGISAQYFETLFKSKFSAVPKVYLTNLRIKKAKELLLSSKKNITEISEALGYCDVYHFSKIFKKETGYTPSEYRKIK